MALLSILSFLLFFEPHKNGILGCFINGFNTFLSGWTG